MLNRRTLLALALSGAAAAALTRFSLPVELAQAASSAGNGALSVTGRGFDPYLHRPTGEVADPINLLFRGDVATTAAALRQVLGWYPVAGSPMLFLDHRGLHPTAVQMGFNLEHGSRYHIRLGAVEQDQGETYVLAGVHRDDNFACGHVGLAFDTVRDLVAEGFAQAGYATSRLALRNIQPGPQCNGTETAGDGTAIVVDLAGGRQGVLPLL